MKAKARLWSAVLVLAMAVGASAQTPRLVGYSGVVRDAMGVPRTGVVTLTFNLYAEEDGSVPLVQETQSVTLDAEGRYTVFLGATFPEGLPLEVFATGAARWLGVQPDGDVESPRVALVSVPYALKAADAETVGGKPASAFVLADPAESTTRTSGTTATITPQASSGTAGYLGMFTNSTDLGNSVVFQSGTRIGVGTTAPGAPFHTIASETPGSFFDVYSNFLGALPVVYRAARGTPAAPTAVQTDDILGGLAVRGYATSGFTPGKGQVMFRAAEPWTDTANGTYLQFTTTPIGSSVFAERIRITPGGNIGIGTSVPAQKLSVAGTIESTSGGFKFPDGTTQASAGVAGGSTLTTGIIFDVSSGNAVNVSTDALTPGVYAETFNTGEASAIVGVGNALLATGVEGRSSHGFGVAGYTGTGAGVYGEADDVVNGWAGLFTGDLGISNDLYVTGHAIIGGNAQIQGMLSKGGGTFRIDHPLDPENKYLSHSFVESPDMKNIYDGIATLDGSGEALVTLPEWFQALNRDYRYQLTSIGAYMPLYVADELSNNSFRIAGGLPGKKVSWQVTGIRQDAFANANRVQVEEDKPASEQGKYLHPEAFNQPAEKAVPRKGGASNGRRK